MLTNLSIEVSIWVAAPIFCLALYAILRILVEILDS